VKRFWTSRRARFASATAVAVVVGGAVASIGAAAFGISPAHVLGAPVRLAEGAQELAAPSDTSAVDQQYAPGKTTICHRTGSQTNPWVMITVSNNALPAHAAHGDIIPAPAGGCPTAAAPTGATQQSAPVKPKKAKKQKHAGTHGKKSGRGGKSHGNKSHAPKTKTDRVQSPLKTQHGNSRKDARPNTKKTKVKTHPQPGAAAHGPSVPRQHGKPANPGQRPQQSGGSSGRGNGGVGKNK
jgi:hypothetical protein